MRCTGDGPARCHAAPAHRLSRCTGGRSWLVSRVSPQISLRRATPLPPPPPGVRVAVALALACPRCLPACLAACLRCAALLCSLASALLRPSRCGPACACALRFCGPSAGGLPRCCAPGRVAAAVCHLDASRPLEGIVAVASAAANMPPYC